MNLNFFKLKKNPELAEKVKSINSGKIKSWFAKQLIYLVIGSIPGFLFGIRYFESGNSGLVKGATVKVSGPCIQNGKNRKQPLSEDEVKITSFDGKTLSGVIRETREYVSCNTENVSIDVLPLFPDAAPALAAKYSSPKKSPGITPQEEKVDDLFGKDLVNKSYKVSGVCKNTISLSQEVLADQIVDVTAVRKNNDKYYLVGVNKQAKTSLECLVDDVKYDAVVIDEKVSNQAVRLEDDIDYTGKTVLVTSTCYPDLKATGGKVPQGQSGRLFYPLVNAPVQVTGYKIEKGSKRMLMLTGALLKRGAFIECDAEKSAIIYKLFDPSTMVLKTILEEQKDGK